MSSTWYFDFLGSVWGQLPGEDRETFGELWKGYEQVFAGAYQKFAEGSINVAVKDMLPYTTERWLPYSFSSANQITRPAVLRSTQDLSMGVNLALRYMLRFRVDGNLTFTVDLRGQDPLRTMIDEIVAKINIAAGFRFASTVLSGSVLELTSPTSGVSSSIEVLPTAVSGANASEFILGLLPADLPVKVPEYPYIYTLPYTRVASIPALRDKIRDESVELTLAEGEDYVIEDQKRIAFKEMPPASLWAKRSLIDEEGPWNNFGYLMGIYQKNSSRYVDVLQGLWFAFWTGPKPENVQTSLNLLFGLPTAQEDGTVAEVTTTAIRTIGDNGVVRIFTIPSGLESRVAAGDRVAKFYPLVTGVDVYDKINRPGFIRDEIGRAGIQRFLTEQASRGPGPDTDESRALRLLEEYTFLPQISVEAFITPDINLENVKTFLNAIKPINQTYLFQVIVGSFRDAMPVLDRVGPSPHINVTPTLDSNETTYQPLDALLAHEETEDIGLNLDPNGILFTEAVAIEVYEAGTLTDSFDA